MKPHKKNRSRAYFRHHRQRVIRRKSKIARHTGWNSRFSGYFAKGKVHCFCEMCAQKTKKDGFHHSQIKQLERLNSQFHNYLRDLQIQPFTSLRTIMSLALLRNNSSMHRK